MAAVCAGAELFSRSMRRTVRIVSREVFAVARADESAVATVGAQEGTHRVAFCWPDLLVHTSSSRLSLRGNEVPPGRQVMANQLGKIGSSQKSVMKNRHFSDSRQHANE